MSFWDHVPQTFQYLRVWASRYGLRGLTVYFGRQPPLEKLASRGELVELRAAYEIIAERGDAAAISAWCLSVRAGTAANEAKEHIRGLLLLFERLADRGLPPFTDGRVRFISPEPQPFDWSVLPAHLRQFEPWLKKFEEFGEYDLYQYVQHANESQVRELAALKELLDHDNESLSEWCATNNRKGNPAKHEAFQAEWLFVLVDFAESRIEDLS